MALRPRLTEVSQRLQLAHDVHLPALQNLLMAIRDVITRSSRAAAGLRDEYARLAAEHGAILLEDAAEELDSLRSAEGRCWKTSVQRSIHTLGGVEWES